MRGVLRGGVVVLVAIGLLWSDPSWAQSASTPAADPQDLPMGTPAQESGQVAALRPSQAPDDDLSAVPYRWSVGGGVGQISGATPVGAVDNIFFTTGFETGSAVHWNVRGSARLWWRLGAEVEFGNASPGVDAILTDPSGAQLTQFAFADFSQSYLSASARIDLVDARITPFLIGGFATVFSSGEQDSETSPGFLFGGGVDVAIRGPLFFRADVKGLRATVDAAGLTRGRLITGVPATDPPLSTQVLWTVGVAIRFK